MTADEVIGTQTLNPFSEAFGTGFMDFASPLGVQGLIQVDGRRVDVLAVITAAPGTGQFRAFLEGLQECFDEIVFVECWSHFLVSVLERKGFVRERSYDRDPKADCIRWRKTK